MSGDNGKITLAVLGQQMQEMLRRQDKTDGKLDSINDKLDGVMMDHASCSATQEARWERNEKELSALNAKKWAGDIGAALAGIVAAAVAAASKGP